MTEIFQYFKNRSGRLLLLGCILVLAASPILAAGKFTVTTPAALANLLATKNECHIVLDGSFAMETPLIILEKQGITIDGQGSTWTLGPEFYLQVKNSSRIEIKNVNIVDPQNRSAGGSGNVFEFYGADHSGLTDIRYENTNAAVTKLWFAFIRKGSFRCYVRKCEIIKVDKGIFIGHDKDSIGFPTTECVAENNRITQARTFGINTRDNEYRVVDLDEDTVNKPLAFDMNHWLRHTIRNNYIGITHTDDQSDANFGAIGIEIWGHGNTVEGNVIEADPDPNSTAYMGISIGGAAHTLCRNNRVKGPFFYQGIEIAYSPYCIVSGNVIEDVKGIPGKPLDVNCFGMGISRREEKDSDGNTILKLASSESNLISGNYFLNCARGLSVAGSGGKSKNTLAIGNTFRQSSLTAIVISGSVCDLRNNKFLGNNTDITNVDGFSVQEPIQITDNDFGGTSGNILLNAYNYGGPRGVVVAPFLFSRNRVHGWGRHSAPEAIVLGGFPSKISGNWFQKDDLESPSVLVSTNEAAKDIEVVFKDNAVTDGIPFTIPQNNAVGDPLTDRYQVDSTLFYQVN